MDGRYGSLADQKARIEDRESVKRQRRPEALSLGFTFLILFVVIIVTILIGLLYRRIAPTTIFSKNLLATARANNNSGGANVGNGDLRSICIADSDCGAGFECSNDECCFFGSPNLTNVQVNLGSQATTNIVVTYTFGPSFGPGTIAEVVLESPTGVQLASKIGAATGTTTIFAVDFSVPIKIIFSNTLYRVKVRTTYSCGSAVNATSPFSTPVTFNTGNCSSLIVPVDSYRTETSGLFASFVGSAAILNSFVAPTSASFIVATSAGLHPNLAQTLYQNVLFQLGFTNFVPVLFYGLPFLASSGQTVYVRAFAPDNNVGGCLTNLTNELAYTV